MWRVPPLHVCIHRAPQWAVPNVHDGGQLNLWRCCCPLLLMLALPLLPLLPLSLLPPLVPCRSACAGAMLHADKFCHSTGLCSSRHRCSCGRPPTEPLRGNKSCCRPCDCRHAGLQSRTAPYQLSVAVLGLPSALWPQHCSCRWRHQETGSYC